MSLIYCGDTSYAWSLLLSFNATRVLADLEKSSFPHLAALALNNIFNKLKLETFTSFDEFKGMIRNVVMET